MNSSQIRTAIFAAIVLTLFVGSRTGAEFAIEYQWWKELHQIETWITMLLYRFLPVVIVSLLCWPVLLWAHRCGVRFAGISVSDYQVYSKLVPAALLLASFALVGSSVDTHKVMTYFGSQGAELSTDNWSDPVFGNGLPFYLFQLPFYTLVLRCIFATTVLSGLIFWASGRGWQIFEKVRKFRASGGSVEEFDPGPSPLLLEGATQTRFSRILVSVGLVALAGWFFLQRYALMMNQHTFMSGMDFLDENVALPLRWLVVIAALVSVPLALTARWKLMIATLAAAFAANAITPTIVRAVYVRPNELVLEKSYIQRHIEATTSAFGLSERASEQSFGDSQQDQLDVNEHSTLVDNIRLWDWRAFSDTITQIQALRPYYRFADVDIDRYTIDGKIKQVLLSPREIDVNALPAEARASWINPHFVYTHGYGVVMSEVNRTTDDGLPVLLIQDAPPEIKIPDIKLERPEIYYGEATHDPVFVNTEQSEFDYPAGDQNITSSYQGTGGFPISSVWLRLLASIVQADYNILLTGYMSEDSRMMLHRNVSQRLDHLAGFIEWDSDPYLFITEEGRLMWIVDGYTTSDSHPYSLSVRRAEFASPFNYIRNSVKATIDAYDGTTTLYVFEPNDPIIQVYQSLFPTLFKDHSEMPPSPRSHARYPEMMFQVQADVYRTYHMRDPEVFYNKEDVWEVAKSLFGDTGTAAPMAPTYIVATVPGESEPEYLLMLPFTPRSKDNLIGWMAARCDGEKLGELLFFQLSKQQLVFGPNQIESRINQDENISKDLSLWNQQGSRVLRGDIIALPVGESFLYVESIYIQAETARMPQLKKVVLAMGNRLIYEDTFEEALSELSGEDVRLAMLSESRQDIAKSGEPGSGSSSTATLSRQHLRAITVRVRKLRQQARKLANELEQIESDLVR